MTKEELVEIIEKAFVDFELDGEQIADCAICFGSGELFMWDGEEMKRYDVDEIDGEEIDYEDDPGTLLN
jgi:hypothetical protein